MSEINPITSTSCEKMTGTGVHRVEHSKKSRDPSFEHLQIYDRNLPIKNHIPNTLVGVTQVKAYRVCPLKKKEQHAHVDSGLYMDRVCSVVTCQAIFKSL